MSRSWICSSASRLCSVLTVPSFSRRRRSRLWRSKREVVRCPACSVVKCRRPLDNVFARPGRPPGRRPAALVAAPISSLPPNSPTAAAALLRQSRLLPGSASIPAADETRTTDAAPHAHRPGQSPPQWPHPHRWAGCRGACAPNCPPRSINAAQEPKDPSATPVSAWRTTSNSPRPARVRVPNVPLQYHARQQLRFRQRCTPQPLANGTLDAPPPLAGPGIAQSLGGWRKPAVAGFLRTADSGYHRLVVSCPRLCAGIRRRGTRGLAAGQRRSGQ